MSVSGGTGSRGRPGKDKQHSQTTKTDSHATKTKVHQQATPEQIRLAQMIDNSDDSAVVQNIQQLVEVTGKSADEVAVALHDALNDPEQAYLLLIEGETPNKSEWQEGGKKKKQRAPPPQPATTSVESMNHTGDGRVKQTENHDKENDRPETSNARRPRRNDARPPRLSRGRGRDRGGAPESGGAEDGGDVEGRSRGRGRGRGSRGPGRGANRGSAPRPYRGGFESSPPTVDQGPQIDLWTNETAENAQKEMVVEDWSDDLWTGGLEESKVFVGSSSPPAPTTIDDIMPDSSITSNTQGQRINLRELLPDSSALPDNYMATQDTNGYMVTGDTSSFMTDTNNYMVAPDSNSYMVATPGDPGLDPQYMNQLKEATESIKNSIGIGSSSRQVMGSVSPLVGSGTGLGQMTTMSSSPPGLSQSAQQRTKPQRSRMPAPSKIPASAVEMPGMQVSSVDVQFGGDSFVFSAPNTDTSPIYQQNRPNAMPNNIDQVAAIKSNDSAITSAILSSGHPGRLDMIDPATGRPIYNNYPSPATPEQSTLPQISSPPEPIPFPTMQTDRSSSTQRSSHTPNSIIHGQLANQGDPSLSAGFGQSSSAYKSPAFTLSPSHMTQTVQYNLAGTQNQYGATPVTQYNPAAGQFSSPTSQYSGSTSGPYNAGTTYPPASFQSNSTAAAALYPNQPSSGVSSSYTSQQPSSGFHDAQPNSATYKTPAISQSYEPLVPASMYQSRDQSNTSAFSSQRDASAAAFSTRDQGTSAYGGSRDQSNFGSRDQQSAARNYPRDQTSGGYNSTSPGAYLRSDPLPNQSAYPRETFSRENQTSGNSGSLGGTYPREQSGAYPRESPAASYPRDVTGSYPRDTTTQPSSFSRDSTIYSQAQSDSVIAYSLDSQSAAASYQVDTQTTYGSATQSAFTPQTTTPSYGSTTQNPTSAFAAQPQTSNKIGYGSQIPNSTLNYGSQLQSQTQDITLPVTTAKTGFGSTPSPAGGYSAQNVASAYGAQTQNLSSYGGQTNAPSTNYGAQLQNNSYSASGYGSGVQSQNMAAGFNSSQNYASQYNATSYNTQTFAAGTSHNKLGDNFSKLAIKDSSTPADSGSSPVSATTTSTFSVPSTISASTIASSMHLSNSVTNVKSSLPTTTKASSNLLHSMPMMNAQYIMGQTSLPPYFPVYPTYDEMQLLQQSRGLPLGSYYDMNFASPTALTGRDQTNLGTLPYTGAAEGKVNRLDAQSPVPASQTQASQSHQQTFINPTIPPGYSFYPYSHMLPGTNFQYAQTMYMPPVTNTGPHGGSSAPGLQYQKAYTSHGYSSNKAYDEMNHTADFVKGPYASQPSKVSSTSGASGVADNMSGPAAYPKSHAAQGFDKQGFHTATPSPFSLPGMPTGSQMGALSNPNWFMMAPHSQMIHHQLQQDGAGNSRGSQQAGGVTKTGMNKPYSPYWN